MIKTIIRRGFTAIRIVLYKILDPIYIWLDKKHIRRTKNIQLIWCIDAKKICAPYNKVKIPRKI